MTPEDELLRWFKREYRRRTKAIREGTAQVDWLAPAYRVSMTEVISKAEELGMAPCKNIVDFRLWWAGAIKPART